MSSLVWSPHLMRAIPIYLGADGRLSFERPREEINRLWVRVPEGSELKPLLGRLVLVTPPIARVSGCWFAEDVAREARRAGGKFQEVMPAPAAL